MKQLSCDEDKTQNYDRTLFLDMLMSYAKCKSDKGEKLESMLKYYLGIAGSTQLCSWYTEDIISIAYSVASLAAAAVYFIIVAKANQALSLAVDIHAFAEEVFENRGAPTDKQRDVFALMEKLNGLKTKTQEEEKSNG